MKAFRWLFATATVIASCSTLTPSSSDSEVSTQTSALSPAGTGCANHAECESGFCVDAVCCDTACGGGVPDAFSCSSVYGAISQLVDGTCYALEPGDPCGSLTGTAPCTLQGGVLNDQQECLVDSLSAQTACFTCGSPNECTTAFPVCANSECSQCDEDFGGSSPSACGASEPVCHDGVCVECTASNVSACDIVNPACDRTTNSCAPCDADHGAGGARPCPSSAAPACIFGECVECTPENTTACGGNTPGCNFLTNTCQGCDGDYRDIQGVSTCPSYDNPVCALDGSCHKCAGALDCVFSPQQTPECGPQTGFCGAGCLDDEDCGFGTWCADAVCVPQAPNGQPIPDTTPFFGHCDTDSGEVVCESKICSTLDDRCGLQHLEECVDDEQCRAEVCFFIDQLDQTGLCGLPLGEPCSTRYACRSGVCTPEGSCGGCDDDGACGGPNSGMVCDLLNGECVAGCRGTGGNACAPDQACTSSNSAIGSCVECLADADCGGAGSGLVCNLDTRTCVSGCRGIGGNGCPGGAGCSSNDGAIGVCGDCLTDADCGGPSSGMVCLEPFRICSAGCRSTGGNGCPSDTVCNATDPDVVGSCLECTTDARCGGTDSGRVCDESAGVCEDGCRGSGNGCPPGEACPSTDDEIALCVPIPDPIPDAGGPECSADSDCGSATSGRVCDDDACIDGCRGTGGNGCPSGEVCSSTDDSVGTCAAEAEDACSADSDCGSTTSGRVCDDDEKECFDGCRGTGGNGCPSNLECTSTSADIGSCVAPVATGDHGVLEGGGFSCSSSVARPPVAPGRARSFAAFGAALTLLLLGRRRSRARLTEPRD